MLHALGLHGRDFAADELIPPALLGLRPFEEPIGGHGFAFWDCHHKNILPQRRTKRQNIGDRECRRGRVLPMDSVLAWTAFTESPLRPPLSLSPQARLGVPASQPYRVRKRARWGERTLAPPRRDC